ncbi:MAG: type VI secretion system tube protein Hcp [Aquabacterium sp.]
MPPPPWPGTSPPTSRKADSPRRRAPCPWEICSSRSKAPVRVRSRANASKTGHVDEIAVLGWNWGMDVSAASFGSTAARTTMQELVVRKRVDRASTALMSALRANEPLKKVILTARKVGGGCPRGLPEDHHREGAHHVAPHRLGQR